jgi:hypothetical protein
MLRAGCPKVSRFSRPWIPPLRKARGFHKAGPTSRRLIAHPQSTVLGFRTFHHDQPVTAFWHPHKYCHPERSEGPHAHSSACGANEWSTRRSSDDRRGCGASSNILSVLREADDENHDWDRDGIPAPTDCNRPLRRGSRRDSRCSRGHRPCSNDERMLCPMLHTPRPRLE